MGANVALLSGSAFIISLALWIGYCVGTAEQLDKDYVRYHNSKCMCKIKVSPRESLVMRGTVDDY